MPALLHLTCHALLGSLLAWCTRQAPRAQAYFWAWPPLVGLAYATGILLPLAAYQLRFYPDFSLGYAYDPVLYPWAEQQVIWLGLAASLAYVAALLCGYGVTRLGLRSRRWALRLVVPTLAAALSCTTLVAFGERNWLRADYATYWRGEATAWTTTPSGVAVLGAYLLALVGLRVVERRWRARDPAIFGQF